MSKSKQTATKIALLTACDAFFFRVSATRTPGYQELFSIVANKKSSFIFQTSQKL